MKLYNLDESELMNVTEIQVRDSQLVVVGTIMGAMPTQALITPTQLRRSLGLLNPTILWTVIKMFFSR